MPIVPVPPTRAAPLGGLGVHAAILSVLLLAGVDQELAAAIVGAVIALFSTWANYVPPRGGWALVHVLGMRAPASDVAELQRELRALRAQLAMIEAARAKRPRTS